MSEAKSEITLKFNVLPEAEPAPNKKVLVKVTDQNGLVFTALINSKSYRKAEADVASFADWGGSVSGKLGSLSPDGSFEVLDAGIKAFEKQPKGEPAPTA